MLGQKSVDFFPPRHGSGGSQALDGQGGEGVGDIEFLEKKKEALEKSYLTRREELEQLILADKEKQLLAVSEIVNERRGRVDVEIDAYRTSEM